MNYKIAHESDELFHANIKWTSHKDYDDARFDGHDEEHSIYFYMILARFGQSKRVLYIGKAYRQFASDRLGQSDHIQRRNKLAKNYPRHQLLVSFGIVDFDGLRCSHRRIDEIETVLIYSNWDDRLVNSKKVFGCEIRGQVRVTNSGYYRPLRRECFHGTVYR